MKYKMKLTMAKKSGSDRLKTNMWKIQIKYNKKDGKASEVIPEDA